MRPITITTGQYGDLPFAEVCRTMSEIGYDGLEIACHTHLDAHRFLEDRAYAGSIREELEKVAAAL